MRGTMLVAMAAALMGLGCEITPGKSFTWRSTINTQFNVGDGEDRELGYWHFADSFEFNPGRVSLKLGYRADQSQGPSTPSALTWRFRVYDPTFTNLKFTYDFDTVGKMKQRGCCSYAVSFKGRDDGFPGWNADAGDNLVWSVQPSGGMLPTGVGLSVNYVYAAAAR